MSVVSSAVWASEDLATDKAAPAPIYLIGPGDTLDIEVWGNVELSRSVTVRPDGQISVPFLQDLIVAGKSPSALAREIEDGLALYVSDPKVTVIVSSGVGAMTQRIRIVGEAVGPQVVAYRAGITLFDVLVAIGGLPPTAAGNSAIISRREGETIHQIPVRLDDLMNRGDIRANMAMAPGDVLLIPEGFFAGDWMISYDASASLTFTDNIDLEPSDEADWALIAAAGPGVFVQADTSRFQLSFAGSVLGVVQTSGDEDVNLDVDVSAVSTAELSRDLLFLDTSASVSQQVLDLRSAESAAGSNFLNQDTVAVATVSPYLVQHFGGFADGELRYSFSPVLIESSDVSDSMTHELDFLLQSGRDFQRFSWTLDARASQVMRTDESDIDEESVDLGVEYPLFRNEFFLLGGGGYERRDGDDNSDFNFDGPTWRGGFRWLPGQSTTLEATYGRRADDESLDAHFRQELGSNWAFDASYSEPLETAQESLVRDLSVIGTDPDTGEFIDIRTGSAFDPNTNPFTLEDETTRNKVLRLGLDGVAGRNTISINSSWGRQDGSADGDEESISVGANWTRPLSNQLSLFVSAGYERTEFNDIDDRRDEDYTVGGTLSYDIYADVAATFSYFFQRRISDEDNESFTENAVVLGIRATF